VRPDFFVFDRSVTPVLLFSLLYLGVAASAGSLTSPSILAVHWIGLTAVVTATAVMMALYDRRLLDLGLLQPPSRALRQLARGLLAALLLATLIDALMVLAGGVAHQFSGRIYLSEVLMLFVPAVLHEELVFRGYPFQKLLQSSEPFAIVFGALVFAVAHLGNQFFSSLAIFNVFLAGLLLSLLFVWTRSLWTPIGFHFGWNLVTGPVLGHEVSGYIPSGTLLTAEDRGAVLLSGGGFGMEGSLCATVFQIAAVLLLMWKIAQNRTRRPAVDTLATTGVVPSERIDPGTE
jgi:membrane protease YdiL (CAAX protease family)